MKRFKALDVFRGMTVCLMIIVNTTGDWSKTFAPLLHAKWHGFTPTDLVFPAFLFAVGTSFAFVKTRWADKSLGDVIGKILKRTFIIFIIGYLLYWFPFMKWSSGELAGFPISETRIFGVLQRIALCYFMAAILIFFLSKRQLVIASALILLGYWLVLWGFGDYTLENNFARTVDLWLMGGSHMYKGEGMAFDPEGLLSTFPAVVNVIGGYLAGVYIIRGQQIDFEKLAKLLMTGCALLGLAYLWDLSFPINKKIWTSSYVVLTNGICLIILAFLVYNLDFARKPFNYRFFEVFGKNPLIIYLISQFLAIILWFVRVDETPLYTYIYKNGFSWIGPYWGAFAFAITFMLLCWSIGWWMDKRKIYIRV